MGATVVDADVDDDAIEDVFPVELLRWVSVLLDVIVLFKLPLLLFVVARMSRSSLKLFC